MYGMDATVASISYEMKYWLLMFLEEGRYIILFSTHSRF